MQQQFKVFVVVQRSRVREAKHVDEIRRVMSDVGGRMAGGGTCMGMKVGG